MSKSLILVRGIPGSGKSTFAKMVSFGDPVISADDFFMKTGKYVFDKEKLGMAHSWCQSVALNYMMAGKSKIFVANTFTTEKEMKPYFDFAQKYGYKVFSIIVENRHENESIHNVPANTVDIMKQRFDVKL